MTPDVKPKVPSKGGGRPGMNPLFAGIIIGLLMGVFLALGVAIWLNRSATPFVEKAKPVEAIALGKNAPPVAIANPEKPRFEFYQLLPGEKDVASKKSNEPPVRESATATTKDVPKVALPVQLPDAPKDTKAEPSSPKTTNEVLFLQAGAFQNETDAENLKAKVAFAGFEASVKPVNVAGKGTLYRVRLGPYKSQEEVNRIKSVLSQNGISAAVVRPE